MDRYLLAAGGAAIALAFASPAAARSVHHVGNGASAAARCAVSARADAPLAGPLVGDRALEDKIEELTGVISALSDRLASLEEKLGSSDDQDADDDEAGDDVNLASAHGRQPGLGHRSAHSLRPAKPRLNAPVEGAPTA